VGKRIRKGLRIDLRHRRVGSFTGIGEELAGEHSKARFGLIRGRYQSELPAIPLHFIARRLAHQKAFGGNRRKPAGNARLVHVAGT
jgi:hypothetical protein